MAPCVMNKNRDCIEHRLETMVSKVGIALTEVVETLGMAPEEHICTLANLLVMYTICMDMPLPKLLYAVTQVYGLREKEYLENNCFDDLEDPPTSTPSASSGN